MKVMEKFLKISVIVFFLVAFATAHGSDEKPEYEYECGNKFYRYYLDNEPAEYGLSAGYYAPGKKAYVGLSNYGDVGYQIPRVQLDPPGALLINVIGPATFSNDSKKIWYLYNNWHHDYDWVDSKKGEVPAFAIKVGEDRSGYPILIGRIVRPNGLVLVGVVVPWAGYMYYADENGISVSTNSGYQVLTCKSSVKNETKYLTPSYDFPSNKDDETGCINNWEQYNNDDAPAKNGISAGEYDCNNTAYVGKAKRVPIFTPGRIQIHPQKGFFLTNNPFITNTSYYLVDNRNYNYYWVPANGNNPPNNTVYVRSDSGTWKFGIGRVKTNGQMKIGKILYPVMTVSNDNGPPSFFNDFEILVCDPWPKYKCAQQWKKLNANISVDGFSVDSTSFIGRGTRKCINGCDYGLGKIQSGSNGVNYFDDLTATAVFDNSSNVEYLVKNPSDTYKWQPSRNGVKVVNALELHKEGHRPFYIGMTRINDNVVVGKVRSGDGLFFIDPVTGKQQSTSSYEVLTCTSPDASNGEYEEESDADWYGSFGCPFRKEWNFTERRCVCRDEFRGVFAASGAKWNEEKCSYI
ncbi:hypothetical protein PVAND_015227 [Polypedilum vanderplanki]|uniref:Uncharacterized protein n=1 Tax=Polypedilum vanderplanki TaxID=319348 RepID=A0A9J6BC03_POLVA|nr:hypothetical protein PVAND_015227 [Polypedilum vanderplanki]